MLVVETIARIRREHFIKGKTIKEIARDLRVSRNTVRKVLRSGETSFEYDREVQPRPKLTLVNGGTTFIYLARKHDCDGCELRAQCCPKVPFRKIPRDQHEAARDIARSFAG